MEFVPPKLSVSAQCNYSHQKPERMQIGAALTSEFFIYFTEIDLISVLHCYTQETATRRHSTPVQFIDQKIFKIYFINVLLSSTIYPSCMLIWGKRPSLTLTKGNTALCASYYGQGQSSPSDICLCNERTYSLYINFLKLYFT